jgi:hypothetical protein
MDSPLPGCPLPTPRRSGDDAALGAGLAGTAGAAGGSCAPTLPTAMVVIDGRPPPGRMLEPYITSVPGVQPTRNSSVMQTPILVIGLHDFSSESFSDCTLNWDSPDTGFRGPTLPPSSAPDKAAGVGTWARTSLVVAQDRVFEPAPRARVAFEQFSVEHGRTSPVGLPALLRMLMPEAGLVAVGADRSDA